MERNISTEHRRKALETAVNRIRKSTGVKASVILKKLLSESRAHPGPAGDVLLKVVDEVLSSSEKVETVSCHITFPTSRTNGACR